MDRIQPHCRAPLHANAAGANILNRPRIASRARFRLTLLLAVIAATAGLPGPALAQRAPAGTVYVGGESHSLFEASGVSVDVNAATVTEARERALVQGRVAALREVVAHLAPRDELGRLPSLPANDIIEMVQEFSIANERTSAVRYAADMTVRFDPDSIRRLLRGAKITFTELASKPMVVLPVYVDGGKALLWEDTAWHEAWAHLRVRSPLVPLLLPTGEPADIKAKGEDVLGKDVAILHAIAAHYDAAGVIVAKITVGGAGDNFPITLTQLRGLGTPQEMTLSYTPQAGQSREEALASAAAAVVDAVASNWIRNNLVDLSATAQLTALTPVKDLKDWIRIRERLKEIPLVERVDLQAMTRDRAQVTLRYAGDQTRLQSALAEQDLALNQQGGVWILTTGHKTATDGTP